MTKPLNIYTIIFCMLISFTWICSPLHLFAAEIGGVEIHGFVSQGFLKGTKENNFITNNSGDGSFNYNELGINFSGEIVDRLRLGGQLFLYDRGRYGKDKVSWNSIDWAYADYRVQDWLGVRFGKIKTTWGLYGDTRDIDALRTCIILPPIYNEMLRDSTIAMTGGELYGTIPLHSSGTLYYRIQAGGMELDTDDGTVLRTTDGFARRLPQGSLMVVEDVNADTVYGYSLKWSTPIDNLALQTSLNKTGIEGAITSDSSIPYQRSFSFSSWDQTRWIHSMEYTLGSWVFTGEFSTASMRNNNPIASNPELRGVSRIINERVWYAGASYRFTDWIEAGGYYTSKWDPDDPDGAVYATITGLPAHNKYFKDTAITLRFDPMEWLVFKLEGHFISGSNFLDTVDQFGAAENSYLFASKLTLSF